MSSRRSSVRRREKPPFQRLKDHCRKFTAFMFSNVGIILLVIFYTIGGAFVFQGIELDYESRRNNTEELTVREHDYTNEALARIWSEASEYISLEDPYMFKMRVNEILLEYQKDLVHKHRILEVSVDGRWSFSAAFLYSLTVITTIGYGNISPRSDWGKIVTILYAIIGMPLFLLYLSNIGDVFAKSFKWIYSKVCLCRICPGVARRRLVRERLKLKQLAMNLAIAEMESARNSKRTSSDSSTESGSSVYDSEDYSETTSTSSRSPPYASRAVSRGFNDFGLMNEDEISEIEREIRQSTDEITVPLTVCIFIMIGYIVWGALLFKEWEEWKYLDGSYFCFISLTSIGFGDLVPGEGLITNDKDKVEVSFILCAVYLLLGMALIAMCFNLMQEQVIHNMRAIKRAFKACFRCRR